MSSPPVSTPPPRLYRRFVLVEIGGGPPQLLEETEQSVRMDPIPVMLWRIHLLVEGLTYMVQISRDLTLDPRELPIPCPFLAAGYGARGSFRPPDPGATVIDARFHRALVLFACDDYTAALDTVGYPYRALQI